MAVRSYRVWKASELDALKHRLGMVIGDWALDWLGDRGLATVAGARSLMDQRSVRSPCRGPVMDEGYADGEGLQGGFTSVDFTDDGLRLREQDVVLSDPDNGVGLVRTFEQRQTGIDAGSQVGAGWSWTTSVRLCEGLCRGKVRFAVEYGSGPVSEYEWDDQAELYVSSDATAGETLEALASPGEGAAAFVVTRSDRSQLVFDRQGHLLSWADRKGDRLGFAYDSGRLLQVVDGNGAAVTFNYAEGRPRTITDSDGRVLVRYEYLDGQLAEVTTRHGDVTRYVYSPSGRLSRVLFTDRQTEDVGLQDYRSAEIAFALNGEDQPASVCTAGRATEVLKYCANEADVWCTIAVRQEERPRLLAALLQNSPDPEHAEQVSQLSGLLLEEAFGELGRCAFAAGARPALEREFRGMPPAEQSLPGSGCVTLRLLLARRPVDMVLSGAAVEALLGPRSSGAAAGLPALTSPIEALGRQQTRVALRLALAEITLGELVRLEAGDVIKLDKPIGEPAVLQLDGGQMECLAFLGTREGRKAVRIDALPQSGEASQTSGEETNDETQ